MFGFLAFVAIANLTLGYAVAVYLRGRSGRSPREFVADLFDLTPHVCSVAQAAPQGSPPSPSHDKTHEQQSAPRPAALSPAPSDTFALGSRLALDADLQQQLVKLSSASDSPANPASVVMVELDAGELDADAPEDRLLIGITNAVGEILAESHSTTRIGDQQLLLLLPGDDKSVATQRAERVRQRVEATEFLVDGRPVHATVSCALSQLSSDSIVDELLATLQETLDEAQRLGGNRTFYLDKKTPTPVVPPELNLPSRKCAV